MDKVFILIILVLFALIAIPIYIYFLICCIDYIISAYTKLKDNIEELLYNDKEGE